MRADRCEDREIIEVTGADRFEFLQGLVTNDVNKLSQGLVYAALLSPQGKYLADFFLVPREDAVLIDVKSDFAKGLVQRLSMYKLRADVALQALPLEVYRGVETPPPGSFSDPRDAALGWRHYGALVAEPAGHDWTALRVARSVPETGVELIANDSYILEMGFERLGGVDFKKGCYVGQEVTARMKHKTELRKGLARVQVKGSAAAGTEIVANGKPAGTLYSQADGAGLAYLRFDRANTEMTAGEATVSYCD